MVSIGISKILCGCSIHPALEFQRPQLFVLFFRITRALSLIGRVPNCQLGWSQFESGRARCTNKIKVLNISCIGIYSQIVYVY